METTLSQGGRCYLGEGGDPRQALDADPGQGKEGRAQVQREEGRGGERHQLNISVFKNELQLDGETILLLTVT